MKKSRFTENQILAILKQTESGSAVTELCREHGIRDATSAQPSNSKLV